MTRVSRSRSRTGWNTFGTQTLWTEGVAGTSVINASSSFTNSCSDMTGRPVSASPFDSLQSSGDPLVANGLAKYSVWNRLMTNYVCPTGTASPLPMAAPSGWASRTVAGTNPSRPSVTPLTLMQDVIELPRMVYDAGRYLRNPSLAANPKDGASVFLGAKFGWLPLIEDLNRLANLQSEIVKRNQELDQLYSGAGHRGRISFGETTKVENGSYEICQTPFDRHLWSDWDRVTTTKQWATTRWKPTARPPSSPTDSDRNANLRRVLLGLTPEGLAKGAWDVIPWTWMLGWFTNIGDFALANSNTIPATHGEICLMSYQKVKVTSRGVRPTGGAWDKNEVSIQGGFTIERRQRAVATIATVSASLPYLDAGRLSTLGALFVQRFR